MKPNQTTCKGIVLKDVPPESQSNPATSNAGTVAPLDQDAPSYINDPPPKVAILLCTYQGERHLTDQLESFEIQSHSNWEVWASDDGSEDDTRAILEAYREKWPEGRLSIHSGPAKGFAENFISLTRKATIEADYYAYSDQDDIWEANKLERAVRWLRTVPTNVPALYCSRTRLVDTNNNEIGLTPLFLKPPSFANALVQNIGGGNTMVFNNGARTLISETEINTPIVSHDWWAYLLVTGCGGRLFYDCMPSLRYRLHATNLIGADSSWSLRIKRLGQLWQGRFRNWTDSNIAALLKLESKLTPENRLILERFARARQMGLVFRLINIKRSGVHRQTFLGDLGLLIASIFRRL